MTDKNDNIARDMAIRSTAIDMAIRANCGLVYDEEGRNCYNEDEIVKAASKFEAFIKNGMPSAEGISNPATLNIKPKEEIW